MERRIMYEVVSVIWLFAVIGVYIGYVNFWKPKVVNRTAEYFDVSRIERSVLRGTDWFFVFVDEVWILALAESVNRWIVRGDKLQAGALAVSFMFLCLVNIPMVLSRRKLKRCIPFRRHQEVSAMAESIDRERFTQITEKIWVSQNWIRVDYRFFPKSAVVCAEHTRAYSRRGRVTVRVRMANGKDYMNYRFTEKADIFRKKMEKLESALPINELIGKREGGARWLIDKFDATEILDDYMKTHTTREMIESRELTEAIVAEVQR